MTGFQSKRQASKDLLKQALDALDDALICCHVGTVESFPTAKDALNALIDWHVATALDPEVSSDAQALVDRGAAVAERLRKALVMCSTAGDGLTLAQEAQIRAALGETK